MHISVTFKNLDSSNHFKSYIEDKLRRFDKFFDKTTEANVVLSIEKLRHIAEVNLTCGRLNVNAKEENSDMHAAIDLVLDKLKKQITKSKQKQRGWKNDLKKGYKENEFAKDEPPAQVMIQNIEYKPMDVEEAMMQFNLVADHFIVFTNAQTGQVNVLYRRNDGDLGLIQPL